MYEWNSSLRVAILLIGQQWHTDRRKIREATPPIDDQENGVLHWANEDFTKFEVSA